MKWYGLNISKFCGVLISSDIPVTDEPIFVVPLKRKNHLFKAISEDYKKEAFIAGANLNNHALQVVYNQAEKVDVITNFGRNTRKYNVIQN